MSAVQGQSNLRGSRITIPENPHFGQVVHHGLTAFTHCQWPPTDPAPNAIHGYGDRDTAGILRRSGFRQAGMIAPARSIGRTWTLSTIMDHRDLPLRWPRVHSTCPCQSQAIWPLLRFRPLQGGPCSTWGSSARRLFTSISKEDLDPHYEPIDRSYQQADLSLQWGLTGGLMVRTSPNLLIEARRTSS